MYLPANHHPPNVWILCLSSLKDSCDYDAGDEVAIILTAFKGEDVHQRIVSYAAKANMHVYFGLPRVPFIGKERATP